MKRQKCLCARSEPIMSEHSDFDHVSGRSTTGHEWDGIKELNTPLPRWWLITFYMTIVWAIGYWIVYPAWPLLWSHTTGIWNYSTRAEVATELANLEKIRGDKMVALGAASLEEIEKNPALLAPARAARRCSATIARLATAAAAPEPKAIRI